jgi:hypothetical protein
MALNLNHLKNQIKQMGNNRMKTLTGRFVKEYDKFNADIDNVLGEAVQFVVQHEYKRWKPIEL